MILSLQTAPVKEPLDVEADAKPHLRIGTNAEDGLIGDRIVAARLWGEAFTRRAFLTQTWDLMLDAFPRTCEDAIELPYPPLRSVTSVTYYDTAGVLQTWPTSEYIVTAPAGPRAERGTIRLAYGRTWPSTQLRPNAVSLRFVCGYGDEPAAVPAPIRSALLLVLGELYKTREQTVTGSLAKVPLAAENLLWPFRSLRAR